MYKLKDIISSNVWHGLLGKPPHDADINSLYPSITDMFDVVPIEKNGNKRYQFQKAYPQLFREYNGKSTASLIQQVVASKREDVVELITFLHYFRGVIL